MAKEKIVDRVARLERLAAFALALAGAENPESLEAMTDIFSRPPEDIQLMRQVFSRLLSGQQRKQRQIEDRIAQLDERVTALLEGTRGASPASRSAETGATGSEHVEARFSTAEKNIASLHDTVSNHSQAIASLDKDVSEWLTVVTYGLDSDRLQLRRFLPVRVHLPKGPPQSIDALSKRVEALLGLMGFDVATEFAPERGSWIRRWFGKSREALSQPEVLERVSKVERALQLRGLDLPQAEADQKYITAAGGLLQSLGPNENLTLQIGALLMIRVVGPDGPTSKIIKLSQDQLIALEKNQTWLDSPADLLSKMERVERVKENPTATEDPLSPSDNASIISYAAPKQSDASPKEGGQNQLPALRKPKAGDT